MIDITLMNGSSMQNTGLQNILYFTDEGTFIITAGSDLKSIAEMDNNQVREFVIDGVVYDCTDMENNLMMSIIYENLSEHGELDRLEDVLKTAFPQYSIGQCPRLESDLKNWLDNRLQMDLLDDINVRDAMHIAKHYGFSIEGTNNQFFVSYEKQLVSGFRATDSLDFADKLVDAQMECYLRISNGKADYGKHNDILLYDYSDFAAHIQDKMIDLHNEQAKNIKRFNLHHKHDMVRSRFQDRTLGKITASLDKKKKEKDRNAPDM